MQKFTTLERSKMAVVVVDRIIEMIAAGELQPGEKLPSERKLQELLHIGRPSIREGLTALQLMNICESRVGDGTYISSLDMQSMTKPFEIIMLLAKPTVVEIFEMREMLETGSIRLGAKNLTDMQLEELVCLAAQGPSLVDRPREFVKIDEEIHRLIASGSHNRVVNNVMDVVKSIIHVSRYITTSFIEVRRQAADDHIAIVSALARRDAAEAEENMRIHLQNALKIIMNVDQNILVEGIRAKVAAEYWPGV